MLLLSRVDATRCSGDRPPTVAKTDNMSATIIQHSLYVRIATKRKKNMKCETAIIGHLLSIVGALREGKGRPLAHMSCFIFL
jgi:hypothetical protein